MSMINLFLQKRKMQESRYGIVMVIIAYTLSVFMLIIGSDTFYNINSEAAGVSKTTNEETQEEINSELLKQQPAVPANLLTGLKPQIPYGVIETSQTGLGSVRAAQVRAVEKPEQLTDICFMPTGAMSIQEYKELMGQLTASMSDSKKKAVMNVIALKQTKSDSTKEDINTAESKSRKEDKAETQKNETEEDEIFSLSEEASASGAIDVTDKEVHMLERIVQAEAGGEDTVGKILIVNVIMNRIKDQDFPDTIKDVIFQNDDGEYQFSPVDDERYWKVEISDGTKKAVQRALKGEDHSEGALYFIARKRTKASNAAWFDNNLKWLFKHGGHEFYR